MTDQIGRVTEFRIGSVIGRGFSILLKNIVPFGLLALVLSSPPTIYALVGEPPNDAESIRFDTTSVILLLVNILFGYLLTVVLVYGTVRELRGNRAPIGDCIRGGVAVLLPVIGVAIMTFLVTAVGLLLLIIPGIIASVMLWIAIPAAVVERPGVMASLSRSAELTKGHRWQIFGLVLLLGVLTGIAGALVAGVVAVIVGGLTMDLQSSTIVSVLADLAITAFFAALWAVVAAVSYHDLRIVKEGVGTEEIAAVFD